MVDLYGKWLILLWPLIALLAWIVITKIPTYLPADRSSPGKWGKRPACERSAS